MWWRLAKNKEVEIGYVIPFHPINKNRNILTIRAYQCILSIDIIDIVILKIGHFLLATLSFAVG